MKKATFALIITLLFSVSLTGCGNADMKGIIIEVNEDSITLAENLSNEDYEKVKDKSVKEILEESSAENEVNLDLIDLTYSDTNDFNKGDRVKVWIKGDIFDSYPASANAKKISTRK